MMRADGVFKLAVLIGDATCANHDWTWILTPSILAKATLEERELMSKSAPGSEF
jgi:hypothetical protein